MKAIILAAGMGTRLGKYTKNLPKCMLNFAGKTLIERQVNILKKCGVKDIIVVKGYKAEKIQILGTKSYLNKDYANTNMVETLFRAEKEMNKPILVCYADIIYEKRVLKKIMENKSDIAVTVDADYWEYWQARMKNPKEDMESLVIDSTKKIIELGDTHCSKNQAQVRYLGLIKFSKKGVKALRKIYYENKKKYFHKNKPWLRSKSFKKAYMTCMLQALINAGYRVDPIVVKRGWLEFDTVEDYDKYNLWLRDDSIKRFIAID